MEPMTGIERIGNILKRKPVDRIGYFEHIWVETKQNWVDNGYIGAEESVDDHFGYDIKDITPFSYIANLDAPIELIRETETEIFHRDGNGVIKRSLKEKTYAVESVDFMVKERKDWEEHIKPLIKPDERRINFEGYRKAKKDAAENNRFFVCCALNVFEQMRCVCGHENMLVGMALDPDWIMDMVAVYSQLNTDLQEILFSREGKPDGMWYSEDLGYKGTPFISLQMYKELIKPGHERTIKYAKSNGLPVIMHMDGMVEPLIPQIIEVGVDCMQPIEVKAGMNLVRIFKAYGQAISFMGGMDVRMLFDDDKHAINNELESVIPVVMKNYGYVLHSDHSIPENVKYEIYKYFRERGLELGTY